MLKRNICAICGSTLNNIYSLNNMPIKLSCPDIYVNHTSTLSYSQCIYCNTIQLDELIPPEILYSDSHNIETVGKIWSEYFLFFSDYIKNFINNKIILEIGDPSAKIASLCNNYERWIIVEPSKNTKLLFNEKITFIDGFFDEKTIINDKIDIIIHSHVFEHIYDLNVFLKKCYEILDMDGNMIFGIPNMEYIAINNLSPFLGVFFEHTIFLNKENVSYLLNKFGFEIIDISDYLNHSIIFNVKKNPHKLKNKAEKEKIIRIIDYKKLFIESLDNYKKFIINCNNVICENLYKKCYLFGASYNTQFLLALGLNEENICGILDNSTMKHNKYFYGYNINIMTPNILENEDAIVILNNGVYNEEISKQIFEINKNTIHIIKNNTKS